METNKFLYGIFLSMAILSSCSNEIETENNSSQNIGFAFGVPQAEQDADLNTRGSIVGAGNYNGALSIFAVKDEGNTSNASDNLVSGVYTVVAGKCETLKRWPGHGLAFYAFSPGGTVGTPGTPVYPTSFTSSSTLSYNNYSGGSYTIAAGPAYENHTDLLFGKTATLTYAGLPASKEVAMTLNHILSRITFQIRAVGFNTSDEIRLKNISLTNVSTTATGTYGNGVTNTPGFGFSWTNTATTGTYTMQFSTDLTSDTDGYQVPDAAFGNTDPGSYLAVSSKGESMFLFPHSNGDFTTNNTQLEIVYKVKSDGASASARTYTVNLKDVVTDHSWVMGSWTNYQITLHANYITLNAITVAGWGSANNIPVAVN